MISINQITTYRFVTYGFDKKTHIKNKKQAIEFVNRRGYIFFWPISGVELPSLWGAVSGDRPVPNDHDDPGHVTWGWKDSLIGKHVWYYGKILRKKATIISMDIAPYFYALTENYGSPEEDYLTIYEQGRMTQEAKAVYEALLDNGPLDAIALRKTARLTSRDSDARFAKALTDLQTDFRIMPINVVDAGAWHYAFTYDLVARYEPVLLEKARYMGELDARRKIVELYFESVGAAQFRDLVKLLGWKPSDIERAVGGLVSNDFLRDHQTIEGVSGDWIVRTSLL